VEMVKCYVVQGCDFGGLDIGQVALLFRESLSSSMSELISSNSVSMKSPWSVITFLQSFS
jgi:hypothetical protein